MDNLDVRVIERLLAYHKEGDQALGVYNEKKNATGGAIQVHAQLHPSFAA